MTPPTFQIGDEVLVIGPSCSGRRTLIGGKHKIKEVTHEGNYILDCFGYYPASSLQLVEPELKIGDWVEIVGPSHHGFSEAHGVQFKIEQMFDNEYSAPGVAWYRAKCLRKLTPEEIEAHLHPIRVSATMDCSEFAEGMAKCQDKLWKIGIEARLSAIEKQQKEQHEKISQFDGEISHLMESIQECLMESGDVEARTRCREMTIEKRLDFVEKFQCEQDDLVNRMIRDGAVRIFDFRRKT